MPASTGPLRRRRRELRGDRRAGAGWFHCRADRWLAEQLLLGRVEHETFLALVDLEDGPLSPKEKLELARKSLDRWPDIPPLFLQLGKDLAATGQRPEAEAAYRRGLAFAEEPDVRSRLLVDLASLISTQPERTNLLREAMELQGNLVAAAMAAALLKTGASTGGDDRSKPSSL